MPRLISIESVVAVVALAVGGLWVWSFIGSRQVRPPAATAELDAPKARSQLATFTIAVLSLLAFAQLPLAYTWTSDGTTTIQFVLLLGFVSNLGTAIAYRKPRKGSVGAYAALVALQALLIGFELVTGLGAGVFEIVFMLLQVVALTALVLEWRQPAAQYARDLAH